MALHHTVTFYLYSGGYLTNIWEVSATIAFLHDIADIYIALVKVVVESNYDNIAVAIFVQM